MEELQSWFTQYRRHFPWRDERTPYKVWISEVMLQQTRASVVVPYFLDWMKRFPDVARLAAAAPEEVIKAWEGLGYYSRARNLHKGAKEIVGRFNGEIPGIREELETISGLGPYTIGAILSFGFRQKAPAVDGNVARVVSRYFAVEENICAAKAKKSIWEKTESLLGDDEPWVTAEALIELGATICLPKPKCGACPIRESCLGLKKGIAESLPVKNGEKSIIPIDRVVAVVEAQGKVLVRKGEPGKVMADLYEFPFFEGRMPGRWKARLGGDAKYVKPLKETAHSFTRYKARLFPHLLRTDAPFSVVGGTWIAREKLKELPFSSGHKKIMEQL